MTMECVETPSKNQLEESATVSSKKSAHSNQNNDVIVRHNTPNSKRVSFLFGSQGSDAVAINTIQNIYSLNSSSNTNRVGNKTAYLKLHRHSFSPGSNSTVEKLKGKYEKAFDIKSPLNKAVELHSPASPSNSCDNQPKSDSKQVDLQNTITKTTSHIEELQSSLSNKLTQDTLDKLKQKYSPEGFGYPKTKVASPSRIPVPTPRNSLSQQKAKPETVKVKLTTVENEKALKAPVITEVTPSNFEEIQVIYNHIEFAEPEDKHFIVTRSSSEDSILKLENSLADFIMEKKPKEKKRSNSFRRILSGGLFGRDKKKQEEDKLKSKKKDNAAFADNAQNESQVFDRRSAHRHTVDSSHPRRGLQEKNSFQTQNSSGPLYYYKPQQNYVNTVANRNSDSRYTEMKGNSIIQYRQPNHSLEEYVQMDNSRQTSYLNVNKFIDTSSSSSNTLESDSRNYTYQNALIAQAELRRIHENENRTNSVQVTVPQELHSDSSSSSEAFRSTPACNEKAVKSVELVKPKALIPINSERPLPNPYHNIQENPESYENVAGKTIERNLNVENLKPIPNKNNLYEERVKSPNSTVIVEDVYGTVFDSISSVNNEKCKSPSFVNQISPKSLEASKLKLPPNREKVELQPRIRSPIPQAKVSTDKIIATELLRNKGSPSRSPIGSVERQHTPKVSRNVYENYELKLPNAHSTPRTVSNEYIHLNTATSFPVNKPPPSPRENQGTEVHRRQKESQHVTLATVHADAVDNSVQQRNRSPSAYYNQENSSSGLNSPNRNMHIYQQRTVSPSRNPTPTNSLKSAFINMNQSPDTYMKVHTNVPEDFNKTRIMYRENSLSPLGNSVETSPPPLPMKRVDGYLYGDSDQIETSQSSTNQLFNQQQHRTVSANSDTPYGSLQHRRPCTPVGQNVVVSPVQKSPEKQNMIQNVEAYYWRELKRLKEKEEQDLVNYRQHQFHMYGFVEDPVLLRRSRSVSPTMQRGRRSLSLPRDIRPNSGKAGPETIPEGRPVIDKKPIVLPNGYNNIEYGQIRQHFQPNPNFVRNTFERTTIGPIGRSQYYENYGHPKQGHAPIFKRGSLTSNSGMQNEPQYSGNKKVSFSGSLHPTNVWPTKNGFTQSPPTRRVQREISLEDDVFLPNSPRVSQNRQMENIYMNDFDPTLYRNIQVSLNHSKPDRQRLAEPLYESTSAKHITVSNKVCDIYGQIHDVKQSYNGETRCTPIPPPAQNYGQVRQVGFVYGQLQKNPNQHGPLVMRQSFDHLSAAHPNFVRGTRLTASVNDMYRRYPVDSTNRVEPVRNTVQAPNRPLPPVPERRDSRLILAKKFIRGYPQISDTESGSEAGEVQRILNMGARQRNFNVIGK